MTDKLERLEELSKKIPEARQRKALGDALDTAVQEARGATNAITRLEQLSRFVPLVSSQLTSTERDQLRRWILSLQAIGKRFAEAMDTGELATAADGLKRDLTPAVTHVAELISNGWRGKIDQAFSATGRLGGVLREFPEGYVCVKCWSSHTKSGNLLFSWILHPIWALKNGFCIQRVANSQHLTQT